MCGELDDIGICFTCKNWRYASCILELNWCGPLDRCSGFDPVTSDPPIPIECHDNNLCLSCLYHAPLSEWFCAKYGTDFGAFVCGSYKEAD